MRQASITITATPHTQYVEFKRIASLEDCLQNLQKQIYRINDSGTINHCGQLENKSVKQLAELIQQGLYIATTIPNPYAGKATPFIYPDYYPPGDIFQR